MIRRFVTRLLSGTNSGTTKTEAYIADVLRKKFPQAEHVDAKDVSGGCGAMFEVFVRSPEFIGKRKVAQHRLVNQALDEEIKSMHGLRIFTSIPDDAQSNDSTLSS